MSAIGFIFLGILSLYLVITLFLLGYFFLPLLFTKKNSFPDPSGGLLKLFLIPMIFMGCLLWPFMLYKHLTQKDKSK